ncbi:MAG: glyoxalase [Amylibacter sp.]|nr:glyoxalase [Amylibacter sp.]
MDLETVSASDFGQSLRGVGVNLLTTDMGKLAAFLVGVFDAVAHRISDDFAIVVFKGTILQIHHDATYRAHPLLGLLPDNPPRGAGTQFFMFGVDPNIALARAKEFGGTVLEPAQNKPHGLYEGTILSPEGYAFSPAVPTKDA